jgi:hypothetical protein
MGAGAARLSGDPLRVAGASGDLPVERHRGLEDHERPARAGVLAEGLVQHPRRRGDVAVHEVDLHALVAEDPGAAAGGLGRGVVGCDHHAANARTQDRFRAGRRAAVMAAGLERQVHRRAGRLVA